MPDWAIQLLGMAGVGVYAGIKADLAALHMAVKNIDRAANEAHRRIDDIYDRRGHA